mmetsp:Transcript_23219/g.60753  ORF Transcript_23219/g.60753 Transcript_23219/m.60753 type:complete len:213 (-) Transcript_23219:47-685(-)
MKQPERHATGQHKCSPPKRLPGVQQEAEHTVFRNNFVRAINEITLNLKCQLRHIIFNQLLCAHRGVGVQPRLTNAADVPIHVLADQCHAAVPIPVPSFALPRPTPTARPSPICYSGLSDIWTSLRGWCVQRISPPGIFELGQARLKANVIVEARGSVTFPAVQTQERVKLMSSLTPGLVVWRVSHTLFHQPPRPRHWVQHLDKVLDLTHNNV